jgi:hypothetical protein
MFIKTQYESSAKIMASLVDPGSLYRVENSLLVSKTVRNSWASTMTTVVLGVILLAMIGGFLVAQYNNTLKLNAEESARKNIPFTQVAWNNAVRNVVS